MPSRAGFIVYPDHRDEWRWTLRSRNGRVVADSGEGYTEKRHALRAVARVAAVVADLVGAGPLEVVVNDYPSSGRADSPPGRTSETAAVKVRD